MKWDYKRNAAGLRKWGWLIGFSLIPFPCTECGFWIWLTPRYLAFDFWGMPRLICKDCHNSGIL